MRWNLVGPKRGSFRIVKKFAWFGRLLHDETAIWLESFYALEYFDSHPYGYERHLYPSKYNLGGAPELVVSWYEHENFKTLAELKAWMRADRVHRKECQDNLKELFKNAGIDVDKMGQEI